jgi:hypothetical protein
MGATVKWPAGAHTQLTAHKVLLTADRRSRAQLAGEDGLLPILFRFRLVAGVPKEARLQRIVALGLFVLSGAVAAGPLPIEGSYLARTMNGRPLPTDLRIPVTDGDVRLFRLEQGVLRLSQGGRFVLYFRYYHQLVRRGTRPVQTPVMSDSETGTYTVRASQLTLTPTKKKGTKTRPAISALISGDEIRASYVLRNAGSAERVVLVLRRDASYW